MKKMCLVLTFMILGMGNLYAVRESQGFPAKIIGVPVSQMPVIGNIDSDEEIEILFYASGRLECWKSDGSICPWAPYVINENVELIFSPSLVDLNGDGRMEILFGSADGRLFIMNGDGSIWQNYPKKFANGYISTPSSFDLDKDGSPEICFGTQDRRFYCIKPNGNVLDGFPVKTESPVTTSGSFAYFGEKTEISIAFGCENGDIYVVNAMGRLLKNFPFKTHYVVSGMPVFADINDDGRNELIVGSQDYSLYALNERGRLLDGFPVETGYRIHSSPAIADIDMDGYLDIVITSTDGRLYVFNYKGKALSGFPYDVQSKIFSSPVVGDINCDGLPDIVVSVSDGRVHAVDNRGRSIDGFPYVIGGELKSSPVIADIDNDNRIEMLFLSPKSELHSLLSVNKCEKRSRIIWQMAGHNSSRHGRFFPNSARIWEVGFEKMNLRADESLKIKYNYFHLDGRPEMNTKILWYKNGKHIEDLDGKRVIEPRFFKKHDRIYVEVQDEENFKEYGRLPGSKIIRSPEIEIQNVMPEAPEIDISPKDVFTSMRVDIKIVKESTDYDNDKIEYRYTYFRNNNRLEYSESQAYINPQDIFKNDRITVIVTPFDGEETGRSATMEFKVKNTAPSVCEFDILPPDPVVTSDIEVRIRKPSTDIDKDSLSYVYNLWVDGVLIPYDFKLGKYKGGSFKRDQEIRVGVRAYDGDLYSQEVYKTVKVINSAPLAPEVVILPASPTVEDELRAVIKKPSLDYDRDLINYKYFWYVNGSPVNGVRDGILSSRNFKRGDQVRVEVTPNDGVVDGEKGSSEIKILNARPKDPVFYLEKGILTSVEEARLLLLRESKDADGDNIAYKVEWYNGKSRVTSLDDRLTSKGVALKKHERWTLRVYATDGIDKSRSSEFAFDVKNSPPIKPEISFDKSPVNKNQSLNLRIDKPSLDIDGDKVEYRVRWFANNSEIEKARNSFELRPELFSKNQTIMARVIPFDGEAEGESVEISTFVVNAPLTAPLIDITPKEPTVSDDIVCKVVHEPYDIDGDRIISKFVWYRNSTMFMTTDVDRLDRMFLKKGDKISCEMVSSDGEFVVNHRSAEVIVKNSRPSKADIKILPENPHTRDEMTCVVVKNSEDPDGDRISYSISWKKNDKPFAENTIRIGPEGVVKGNKYTCDVYASDGELKSELASVSVNVLNKRPSAPLVKIEPDYPLEGTDITCKIVKPAEDIEKDEIKYKFFWFRNGHLLNFATTSVSVPGRLIKKGEIYNCEVVPYDYDGDGDKGYSNSVIILEKK